MATILVVEDDPIIRQTVEYALKRAGFSVHTVADGGAALETAARVQPDLVLLDLMLPGMDGYEIAERLRADDKETAIVMVTALDTERDKVRGLDAGADDYITKPFSMEELLARVRANLRRVRTRETLADDSTIEIGDLVIEPKSFRVSVAGKQVKLRLKEFQLLVALARASASSRPASSSPMRSGATSTCPRPARSMCTSAGCGRRSRTPRTTCTSTPFTGWATGSKPSPRYT